MDPNEPSSMKLLILGSCVTRYAFNKDVVPGLNPTIRVRRLFTRSSFISLTSPSFKIGLSEINNLAPFECRYVYEDLNRVFFNFIKTRDCSDTFLILDFIYETLDLLQVKQHFITLSDEFLRSGLLSRFSGLKLSRLESSTTALWKTSCLRFIETVGNIFPPERVILHRAFWKESFKDGQIISEFPDKQRIYDFNAMLKEYYDFFEQSYQGITIVDLNHNSYFADKNHVWGLHPFHYEANYNKDLIAALENILNVNEY